MNLKNQKTTSGAILLEVILALVLFAAAAAVISGALNASVASLERVRASTHAQDLAVSILSQVQMGAIPAVPAGPEPFDAPFSGWTWELQLAPLGQAVRGEAQPLQRVEVIIRQVNGPTVRRLVQWLMIREELESPEPVAKT
jgi:type II secretory pathway pseudopilin PulG